MENIFEKQGTHALLLLFLLAAIIPLYHSFELFSTGELLGWSTTIWFYFAIGVAIAHHLFVLIIWRVELHLKGITNRLPNHGFTIYLTGFFLLFSFRFLLVLFTALSNMSSFSIPVVIKWITVTILALPVIWLFYSVKTYFGFKRAAGADHFFDTYRKMPLVKKGIFKYTNNGMYTYGFLLFWIIALLFESRAALLLAGFNHLYIWVHYYCTEKPDMIRIYGGSNIIG